MERVFAFTDEYGAFGWDLTNPSVATHFIISAIIIKESEIEMVRNGAEEIRLKYFQTGEMKSSKIGSNHKRRKRILADLIKLPFSVFSVVVDKRKLTNMKGLQYKPSFYKFLNNIVHSELRRAFDKLTVVADEIGGSEYMKSFSKYVDGKSDLPTLFEKPKFYFQNSTNDVLLQIADLLSGTLAYEFDIHKKDTTLQYKKILDKKLIRIELYPKTYENYTVDNSAQAEDYNKDIAEICFKQAVLFLEKSKDNEDQDVKAQVITLQYLLFRFMNNNQRKYIPTKELKNQLNYAGIGDISTQSFRTRIIAKMRDKGVIIASSSKGYKIPTKETELYDFINHGTSIIIPMLERLKKCRDLIKLGTANELDLFDNTEYSSLKKYFDN